MPTSVDKVVAAARALNESAITRGSGIGLSAVARSSDSPILRSRSCATPPYCHRWWLTADSSLNIFGTLLLGLFGLVVGTVVVAILCAGIALAVRSCQSCLGGPAASARKAGYLPVEKHDLDFFQDGDGAPSSKESASRCSPFGWCCLGAVAMLCFCMLAFGGGSALWWRASGSPPMWGLGLSVGGNDTSGGGSNNTLSSHHHRPTKL